MPIQIPQGVNVEEVNGLVTIKGSKGEMQHVIPSCVQVTVVDNSIKVAINDNNIESRTLMGTTRALLKNKVEGVSEGFSKNLLLVGVGYKAQVKKVGNIYTVDMSLGLSHPVVYKSPEGVVIEAVNSTELKISGIDKQLVGQVAADIRAYRRPEPYKGKGIRYSDEVIILKETKKK